MPDATVPDEPLTSGEYEDLTRDLVGRIRARLGMLTTRLERNVQIQGRATSNQIDVVWEGRIDEQPHRYVFECKNYKYNVKQSLLFAFRGVLDDIQDDVPTTGVMVTRTGYQAGAKRVADTYGLVVVELRRPTPADTEHRVLQIKVQLTSRNPIVRDLRWDVVEVLAETERLVPASEIVVEGADGALDVQTRFCAGEISPLDSPPTPLHPVTRPFDPPATLSIEGQSVARISAMHAVVGDSDASFEINVGPGLDGLAWMAKDALGGSRAWFAADGKIYFSPE